MTFYFALIVHALLPVALINSALDAAYRAKSPRSLMAWTFLSLCLGIGLGSLALHLHTTSDAEILMSICGLAGLLCALATITPHVQHRKTLQSFCIYIATFSLGIYGGFNLSSGLGQESFTATSVINTEAILNCVGLGLGIILISTLSRTTNVLFQQKLSIAKYILMICIGLYACLWGGYIFLAALQNDWLDVTSSRVWVIASLDQITPTFPYFALVCILALSLVAYSKRQFFHNHSSTTESPKILHRRQTAFEKKARNRMLSHILCISLLIAPLIYEDFFANLPPTLSPAIEKTADNNGNISIPIQDVSDGNLHRYAFVSSDGHRVRFFLINKYDLPRVRIGVVFDACMICGDTGYIQRGNEIICIACNVHLFRPSIGKSGGCNPIPLDHTISNDTIVINDTVLEEGSRYFSEVVEITVHDPVTGKRLSNTSAPYQYQYEGKSYFFASQASYEAFRKTPGDYVKQEGL